VRGYFEGLVELILDGGATAGGPGSTVADCTVWPPRILRQGPVVVEATCA
jgi:tRNA A37 threonylcarbamoyladenosine synthetase subunit TsaC/SUA5/YrdC